MGFATAMILSVLMSGQYLIYALRDPVSGEFRYVGKSSSGLARPSSHATRAQYERNHKARWIKKLKAAGLKYETVILEKVRDQSDLNSRERWWIAWYRPFGRLTNISDGSREGDQIAASKRAQELSTPEERHQRALNATTMRWAQTSDEDKALFLEKLQKKQREWFESSDPEFRKQVSKRAGAATAAAMTPERRKKVSEHARALGKKQWAKLTEKQKSELSQKINRIKWDAIPQAERQQNAFQVWGQREQKMFEARDRWSESLTPEERSRRAKHASAALTTGQRSDKAKTRLAALTPEQRKEIARKGWVTRRASRALYEKAKDVS